LRAERSNPAARRQARLQNALRLPLMLRFLFGALRARLDCFASLAMTGLELHQEQIQTPSLDRFHARTRANASLLRRFN
jgi:hypothetical protein